MIYITINPKALLLDRLPHALWPSRVWCSCTRACFMYWLVHSLSAKIRVTLHKTIYGIVEATYITSRREHFRWRFPHVPQCLLPRYAGGSPRSTGRHPMNASDFFEEIATIAGASVTQAQDDGLPDAPCTIRWGSGLTHAVV